MHQQLASIRRAWLIAVAVPAVPRAALADVNEPYTSDQNDHKPAEGTPLIVSTLPRQ